MSLNLFNQKYLPGSKYCRPIHGKNDLDIHRVNAFRDSRKNMLVLLMECDSSRDLETSASITGNNLVLEALKDIDFNKPIKTHLIEPKETEILEDGMSTVAFSEFHLRKGYKYTVLSCQVIKPGLLKVNLRYHPVKTIKNNEIIN